MWLASLTQTIVAPVITAAVVAAVASPLIASAEQAPDPAPSVRGDHHARPDRRGRWPVPGRDRRDHGRVERHQRPALGDARSTIQGWLEDIGIDPETAAEANKNAGASVSASFSQLKDGIAHGISALSGLAFFLALTLLSLFFLLSDGPKIRDWAEGHFGVPRPVAHIISGRTLGALRGYFLGVTIVAGFNAAVVTIGALILGVPLVGTIAAVTFVGGYIPYLGAWTAAAFSVLLALGGAGPEAAGGMIIVQLLANGILQQLVQPFAMGAALGIHPLAVLIVTIAGGALFGAAGLILAAPLVSAVVRISEDLSRAQAAEDQAEKQKPDTGEEITNDDP